MALEVVIESRRPTDRKKVLSAAEQRTPEQLKPPRHVKLAPAAAEAMRIQVTIEPANIHLVAE